MTEFKQIIGRGTRINEDYGKFWFTIMDFKKATELFADKDFDGEPVKIYDPKGDDPVDPDEGDEEYTEGDDEGDEVNDPGDIIDGGDWLPTGEDGEEGGNEDLPPRQAIRRLERQGEGARRARAVSRRIGEIDHRVAKRVYSQSAEGRISEYGRFSRSLVEG